MDDNSEIQKTYTHVSSLPVIVGKIILQHQNLLELENALVLLKTIDYYKAKYSPLTIYSFVTYFISDKPYNLNALEYNKQVKKLQYVM